MKGYACARATEPTSGLEEGLQGLAPRMLAGSRKSARVGSTSFIFLRFRTAITARFAMLPASSGSPGTSAQWSNTHWGKARPPAAARSWSVSLNASLTGMWDLTTTIGVPTRGSTERMVPRLRLSTCWMAFTQFSSVWTSTKNTGSMSRGCAVSRDAMRARRVAGSIWFSPR
eukprot:Mycagemm_TRINITY_DN10303_c0_g10::TRINITY_DN10303_c0_g10_i1::g.633::m.633 type:complete len:172 gc:universal TRINITY_DN10303_c0_g10_i1:760-245(-)